MKKSQKQQQRKQQQKQQAQRQILEKMKRQAMEENLKQPGKLITKIGFEFDVYEEGVEISSIDLKGIDKELENRRLEIYALRKQIIELKKKYKEPLTKEEQRHEIEIENEFELPKEIRDIADMLLEAIFENIER